MKITYSKVPSNGAFTIIGSGGWKLFQKLIIGGGG